MSERHTIFLEILPVAKGRPKVGNGFVFTPKKTREYERAVQSMAKGQFGFNPIENKPIRVTLVFCFPRPNKPKNSQWHIVRPDADNLAKAILDALNGITWDDDALIAELFIQKTYAKEGMSPRVVVTFETIAD